MKLKAHGFETIQLLEDGTHDIEGVFELPNTKNGKEQSIVMTLSKYDGKTYANITHEVEGYHSDLGEFKIPKELFETASNQKKGTRTK